jgi:hypothetical protein
MNNEEAQAYLAWQEYYDGMERMYGLRPVRKTFFENRYRKRFIKIGKLCAQNGVDTAEFIRTAMHMIAKDHEYITPADFSNPRLFARFLDLKQHGRGLYERDWLTQVMELTTLVCDNVPRIYASETEVLLNPRLPFSSWFRLMYPAVPDTRLTASYGRAAWTQLQQDGGLRAFLRKQAPKNMVRLEQELGRLDVPQRDE